MLAAIADAKAAHDDSAGHSKRLESINATLRSLVVETQDELLGMTSNEEQIELKGGQLRAALDKVLRGATQATADILEADVVSTRKQLKDKDNWWKLKLETVRVGITMQLKNQATELEAIHVRQMDEKLEELRERLTVELSRDDQDAALEEARANIDKLKSVIGMMEAGKSTLKEEIEATKSELKVANTELGTAMTRASELQTELATSQQESSERIFQLQEELSTSQRVATEEIAQIRAQLEKSQADATGAQQELQGMRERHAKDQADIEVLRNERDALAHEKATTASALQEAQGAVQTAQQKQQQAEAEVTRLHEEMQHIRVELEEKFTAELNALKERLANSEEAVVKLRKELSKVQDELIKSKEAAETMRRQLDTALADVSRLQEELAACQSKLQLRLVDLSKAHNELSEKCVLIDVLAKQVTAMQENNMAWVEERDALIKERDQLVAALQQASKAVEAAALAAQSRDLELQKLKAELVELRPAYKGCLEQRDREREKCRVALKKIEQHVAKETELDQLLDTLVSRYKATSEAHKKAAAQLQETTETLESFTKASKQERERIVRLSLESLQSLRRHLTTTLGIVSDAKVGPDLVDIKPIYRTSMSLPSIATKRTTSSMIRDAVLTHQHPASIDELSYVFDDGQVRPRRLPARLTAPAVPGTPTRVSAAAG